MKGFGKKILRIAGITAIALWLLWGLISTFGGVAGVTLIGNGSLLIGFLKLPLCLFGGIQVVRGFYTLIGKDVEKMGESGQYNYTLCMLYIIATIAGAIFFCDAYFKLT